MRETQITPQEIISQLCKSPHGALKEYVPIAKRAATERADFLARLISWNRVKGEIRDSKVALPVISLAVPEFNNDELVSNSLANIALLGPRELLRALRFSLELRLTGRMRALRRLVEAYLRKREANWPKWERMAVQHRSTLRELYALAHVKPCETANVILYGRSLDKTPFGPPAGSIFDVVSKLKDMSAIEAAGSIMEWKIPFLVAVGALGKKAKESDLVLALIDRMSPTELVTNTKMLERLGVKTNPALKGAFTKAIEKASKSTKNVLKTSVAADAIEDSDLSEKLRGLQEKQINKLEGIEGNWAVLVDKSGSMKDSIDTGKEISAILSRTVKGKVLLVFFDTSPSIVDVTGLELDAIKKATRHVRDGGGTSIGCGLQALMDRKEDVDGIAIISDGGENSAPWFPLVYPAYCKMVGKDVPIYFYRMSGEANRLSPMLKNSSIDCQEYDLTSGKLDHYALPNIVLTMNVRRYGLYEQIMDFPLLKLEDVLPNLVRKVHA